MWSVGVSLDHKWVSVAGYGSSLEVIPSLLPSHWPLLLPSHRPVLLPSHRPVLLPSHWPVLLPSHWLIALPQIFSMESRECVKRMEYPADGGPGFIWSSVWSADGSTLVCGSWNRWIVVYDVASGFSERTRMQRSDRVYGVACSTTGSHVLVGGRDRAVALYQVEGGQQQWEFQTQDFLYAVDMSGNMRLAVAGGTAKELIVLDAR